MRRSTGAILIETRPATIITSAWRGLARKTSAPNRAISLRGSVMAIISMAQQASPNVAGQIEDLRAQLTIWSKRVVNISGKISPIFVSIPITNLNSVAIPLEDTLLPNVDIPDQQNRNKNHHLKENKCSANVK